MKNENHKHGSFGRFDFVGKLGLFGGISLILTVASIAYLGIRGISYGIDFAGGTEIQVKFEGKVDINQIRTVVEKESFKDVGVQSIGDASEFIIRFQTPQGATEKETNDRQNAAVASLRSKIDSQFAEQKPDYRRIDSVGPQVGAELKRNGFLAVFYSLLVILIFVALRFDYKYAPGAVICLFHDAVITLAIFVAVGKEVNIPIMAAILTLIGFSLNDTIVVFDRIRETAEEYKDAGSKFVINKAINDMLGRTIITSGTVFISSFCLWLLAGGTVSDIAFALCVGITFGVYSSIYVAAPMIIVMEKFKLVRPATRTA